MDKNEGMTPDEIVHMLLVHNMMKRIKHHGQKEMLER